MRNVVLFALENAFISTISGPLEIFSSAGLMWNYLAGEPLDLQFQVTVASLHGEPIKTRTGLVIQPDTSIFDIKYADLILVTSCGEDIETELSHYQPALPWLRQQHSNGAILGSICSGLSLIAATGLLDGKSATTHWGMVDIFRKRFPAIDIKADQLFVDEGDIITSGGGFAGNDLALYLVQRFCGKEQSKQCANALLLDTNRRSQNQFSGILHHRMHQDDRVQEIQSWLDLHYQDEISLDRLAEKYSMSPRNFKRRFKIASGATPLAYLQKLRIEVAKKLLENSDVQINNIAEAVGYLDDNHFRKIFKRHTALTPRDYRNKHS
ncbi:hypothetical protein A9Q81_11000 [Gammaproteobacteria bacterium 42_54_T18]|nr:hypothetical protein A9Q81_11000 [Gammaproteobacteria bacterium 42_54_T18]